MDMRGRMCEVEETAGRAGVDNGGWVGEGRDISGGITGTAGGGTDMRGEEAGGAAGGTEDERGDTTEAEGGDTTEAEGGEETGAETAG